MTEMQTGDPRHGDAPHGDPPHGDTVPDPQGDKLISGKILRILKQVFYYGFPVAARFKTSIRVGSGSALAAIDGTDGQIGADGAFASIFFADRTAPRTASAGWYRSGATARLNSSDGGDIWSVGTVTGQIAQPSWTTIGSFSNGYTTYYTVGYRLSKPSNVVEFRGAMQLGAASNGATAFTLPVGFRPTQVPEVYPCAYFDGTNWVGAMVQVDASYNVSVSAGTAPSGAIAGLSGLRFSIA